MEDVGGCSIGTMMGRYYAMDRSQNWRLTDIAYHTLVCAEGRTMTDPMAAVDASYENDKTPDGEPMFDEYIPAHCMEGYDGIADGDCVLHTNYRQDRAIQLTLAFCDENYEGERKVWPDVTYVGLTRYFDEFDNFMMGPMNTGGAMDQLLGEVVSDAGLRQLRIAETQKFRHVTSFFNGKSTTPFNGEDQVDIPSRFDPASFGTHPEMEAYNVTDAVLERLQDNPYAFVVINYANGDMVGHTGQFEAARKAIEIVDECVGRVTERVLELDGHVLITADHGNSELMKDPETGMVKTSHTLFPVEFIHVARDAHDQPLSESGKLSDIAPTVLELLELPIPAQMTAVSLLKK
jgi:2,3-bisphosphoglycerate-independent phosphoglycerate mutase